jgi:hypothetical protein|tara:strand:- start:495 stop:1382 length:888 start_codon:yes stop_codon:yes gene_type:complete
MALEKMKTRFLITVVLLLISVLYVQSQHVYINAEFISIDENDKKVTHIEMVKTKYKVLNVIEGSYDKDTISFYAHPSSIPKAKSVLLYLNQEKNGEYSFLLSTDLKTKEQVKFYVFVGEKVSLEPFEPQSFIRDNAFKAKYRIIENVYGSYPSELIEFEVYDHYGKPAFGHFDYVLLYVSEGEDGKLYHEKYQYSAVYKTVDGRWAGPLDSEYKHAYNSETKIKPEKIKFLKEVKFSISNYSKEQVNTFFPEPFFEIDTSTSKATAVMGNYVDELFILKLNGTLKARGFTDLLEK